MSACPFHHLHGKDRDAQHAAAAAELVHAAPSAPSAPSAPMSTTAATTDAPAVSDAAAAAAAGCPYHQMLLARQAEQARAAPAEQKASADQPAPRATAASSSDATDGDASGAATAAAAASLAAAAAAAANEGAEEGGRCPLGFDRRPLSEDAIEEEENRLKDQWETDYVRENHPDVSDDAALLPFYRRRAEAMYYFTTAMRAHIDRNIVRAMKRGSLAVQCLYRLLDALERRSAASEEQAASLAELTTVLERASLDDGARSDLVVDVRNLLGVVLGKLGEWWLALGSPQEALQAYSGSCAQFKAVGPREDAQHALSLNFLRIGDIHVMGGSPDRARHAYDLAVSIRKAAFDKDTSRADKGVEYAVALGARARVSDTPAQAQFLLRQAVDLLRDGAAKLGQDFKLSHYMQLFEDMLEQVNADAAAAAAAATEGTDSTGAST